MPLLLAISHFSNFIFCFFKKSCPILALKQRSTDMDRELHEQFTNFCKNDVDNYKQIQEELLKREEKRKDTINKRKRKVRSMDSNSEVNKLNIESCFIH